ncbi:hypothetical protein M378DRAFT_174457 [Amanita muscaria Koide BX008]|uniref:Uncharacterized protein n=1 Tax=Amanita muscaria (strain Koide BX008) TaxID=946122 RepID=A0A0C2WBW7_AMAMK|nr:hypothetical protein M378DRAFT_174457 [Amanita muscaria Koide BX008]
MRVTDSTWRDLLDGVRHGRGQEQVIDMILRNLIVTGQSPTSLCGFWEGALGQCILVTRDPATCSKETVERYSGGPEARHKRRTIVCLHS